MVDGILRVKTNDLKDRLADGCSLHGGGRNTTSMDSVQLALYTMH